MSSIDPKDPQAARRNDEPEGVRKRARKRTRGSCSLTDEPRGARESQAPRLRRVAERCEREAAPKTSRSRSVPNEAGIYQLVRKSTRDSTNLIRSANSFGAHPNVRADTNGAEGKRGPE
jgi:hypothetical protein